MKESKEIVPLKPTIRERVNQAVYNFVNTRFGTICVVILIIVLTTLTVK